MSRVAFRVIALPVLTVFIAVGATENEPAPAAPAQAAVNVPTSTPNPTIRSSSSARYPVVKIVDGDTIEIMKDGAPVKVRLIGIDTPEVVDPRRPVQCFGREASAEAHRMLDGQSVTMETDSSQDAHDTYGRLLAYVYLPNGTLFNEHMIAAGYAHEYTYRLPYAYQERFKAAEKAARAAQRGLWAPDTCNDSAKASNR